jgi:Glycosyl hydrolases family 39
MRKRILGLLVLLIFLPACRTRKAPQAQPVSVAINWEKAVRVSQTAATLQVVVSPLMRRDSPIHDRIFKELRDLRCDGVRYVPWLPYPKLAVAEIEPPAGGKTSWDFSLIDPMTEDFMNATAGHPVILNLSVIPQWMFKTPKPISYPADLNQTTWDYQQGMEFRDPSLKEVADYYARLAGWYAQGGFTDENGQRHASGHHYKIDTWEVLNEIDLEHQMSPQTYTQVYDAIASAIHMVDRHIKFVGLALSITSRPDYFEYFLNHHNHKPGIPLDMISYHFYATQDPGQGPEIEQYTFFDQADTFLAKVRYIEDIRERLSPQTGTTVDEMGAILNDDAHQGEPGHVAKPIPEAYWNLCAALYAYVYGNLSGLGINALAESALAQLPGFFPSVTMLDWDTGQPNARYWVLKLIRQNFGPGDVLVSTSLAPPDVYVQGFITPEGKHKVLLVNKRDRAFQLSLPGSSGGDMQYVDQQTGSQPPAQARLSTDALTLEGFGVAVVTLPSGQPQPK